jgi:hypothetical protein
MTTKGNKNGNNEEKDGSVPCHTVAICAAPTEPDVGEGRVSKGCAQNNTSTERISVTAEVRVLYWFDLALTICFASFSSIDMASSASGVVRASEPRPKTFPGKLDAENKGTFPSSSDLTMPSREKAPSIGVPTGSSHTGARTFWCVCGFEVKLADILPFSSLGPLLVSVLVFSLRSSLGCG